MSNVICLIWILSAEKFTQGFIKSIKQDSSKILPIFILSLTNIGVISILYSNLFRSILKKTKWMIERMSNINFLLEDLPQLGIQIYTQVTMTTDVVTIVSISVSFLQVLTRLLALGFFFFLKRDKKDGISNKSHSL